MSELHEAALIEQIVAEVAQCDMVTAKHLVASRTIMNQFLCELKEIPKYQKLAREEIALGMEIHDIGKTRVPLRILQKPGKLTPQEYEIIKQHSELGAQMISLIAERNITPTLSVAQIIARHHHERWDGEGYPGRLKGEEIPLEARVAAIVDVYEALTGMRSYKEPMSPAEALRIIYAGMGTQFDANLADIFIRKMKRVC